MTAQGQDSSGPKSPTAEEYLDKQEKPTSWAPELDPEHEFAGVVDELTRTAVERFRSAHVDPSRKRSILPAPEKCRKRSRLGPCQDPVIAGSISDIEESDVVPAEHTAKAATRIWPCPFLVRDRISYRSCWTRHCLLTLDQVREHSRCIH